MTNHLEIAEGQIKAINLIGALLFNDSDFSIEQGILSIQLDQHGIGSVPDTIRLLQKFNVIRIEQPGYNVILNSDAIEGIHQHKDLYHYIKWKKQGRQDASEALAISKLSHILANRSFRWTKWNTIFVILTFFVSLVALYFTWK